MREGVVESSFLSGSARKSVQTLSKFDSLFRKTSQRLSTGLKVNSASDNPTAFFTAKSLNARAGDLNRLLDTVGTKLGSVRTADVGIQAIEKLVQLAQAVVSSATNLPAADPTATGSVDVAAQSDVTALAGVADGDQFSVQAGTDTAVTITVNSGDTPDELLAQLNAVDNVQALFTSSGQLQISTTNGQDLILSEVTSTPLSGLGITAGTFDSTTATSPERAAKAAEFDTLLSQIDQLAADSSFLGVNLLAGDSPVLSFSTDGSSSLTLGGVDSSASGLGIAGAANSFRSNSDVSAAGNDLVSAVNSLRDFSSSLSTQLSVADIRNSFTAELRDTLRSGAADLTLADPNEEAASLLALQTRTSIAATSFSITQKAESNILRLFS
jgi:flagellin-like hook-associated protein FlgL